MPKDSTLSAQEMMAAADEFNPPPGKPQRQHDWSKGNFVIYEMALAAVDYCRRRDRAWFKARKNQ
ncbi:hypothetical protein [Synechococcus sp. 1G10]|uniref:hypothetical protein n=1 Tax=Synechococcus sp. 1G10 TaxID=2025605 RepID=UPI000B9854A7|nr:hypothetical protein [Synechococcus sp. 1G10]